MNTSAPFPTVSRLLVIPHFRWMATPSFPPFQGWWFWSCCYLRCTYVAAAEWTQNPEGGGWDGMKEMRLESGGIVNLYCNITSLFGSLSRVSTRNIFVFDSKVRHIIISLVQRKWMGSWGGLLWMLRGILKWLLVVVIGLDCEIKRTDIEQAQKKSGWKGSNPLSRL